MEMIPPPQKREENIPPSEHEINIADGGEFLDDAIRMKDQPPGETMVKKDDESITDPDLNNN